MSGILRVPHPPPPWCSETVRDSYMTRHVTGNRLESAVESTILVRCQNKVRSCVKYLISLGSPYTFVLFLHVICGTLLRTNFHVITCRCDAITSLLVSTGLCVRRVFELMLGAMLVYLSIPVVQNLLSSRQAMNTSFDSFRIVNTYGAFGR